MAIPLKYNIRNLLVRKMTTFATAGGIGLVVLVTILLLSLVTGLERMLFVTGSPDNLIALRKGATSEAASFALREAVQALRYLPGIARTPEDEPLVSPELLAQPLLQRTNGDDAEVGLVRGVTPLGFLVHKNIRFVDGRPPQASLGEAAVGITASQRYQGAQLGEKLQFGRRSWTVVGIFSADGSAFESEVWVDVDDLFNDTNRGAYSAVRLTVAPGTDREALIRRIEDDPRISLAAKSETDYYTQQSEGAKTLYLLTAILAIIMGTGAVFGATNTLFAAVTQRTAEIGTLRALGFRQSAVLISFVSESLCITLIGYVGGVLLGVSAVTLVNVVLQGIAFQLPTFSTAVVTLRISPLILLQALGLAIAMGLLGGFFPARRAARLRVTDALRRA